MSEVPLYIGGSQSRGVRSHSGVRASHQKSTQNETLTLGRCVVQIWSRNTPDSGPNKTRVAQRVVPRMIKKRNSRNRTGFDPFIFLFSLCVLALGKRKTSRNLE